MRLHPVLPAAVAGLLLLAGCTSSAGPSGNAAEDPERVATSAPDATTTLVADADPALSAVSTSRALFDSSPVVVLAGADDRAAQLMGASAAVGLGVPLLLAGAGDGAADELGPELERLGVTAVLAVGGAGAEAAEQAGDVDVVPVDAEAGAVDDATGLSLASGEPVADDRLAAAIADLDAEEPVALVPTDAPPSSAAPDGGDDLPEIERAAPLDGTLVLATGGPESLAGIATARAAGAAVRLTGGDTDPRASAGLVDALREDRPDAVVTLGAGFGAEPGLDWKLATAASGTQLPGGGQLLFPEHTMIALYGVPGSGALGVLGEQDLPASIQRAQDTAAPYRELVDTTVVPTFEIIATVASAVPGPDGNYSTEGDLETLRPWVEAAGAAGMYVVLDLQPGRTDFLTQAKTYQSLLELPYVGLALDPEWRLRPDQVHLRQIGQVGVDEVNEVVTWLADLTRAGDLPQKLLLLHQFRVDMIPDRDRLDTSRDELALMVHADGQGGQGDKRATWRTLRQTEPDEVAWGWKNFYDEDVPMLTAEETVAVEPRPDLISYQ